MNFRHLLGCDTIVAAFISIDRTEKKFFENVIFQPPSFEPSAWQHGKVYPQV